MTRIPHLVGRSLTLLFFVVLMLMGSATRADAMPEFGGFLPPIVAANRLDGEFGEDAIVESLFTKVMDAIASWFLEGAASTTSHVLWKITTASTPVVNGDAQSGDWFAIQYQMMMNVGWWLMLPLLFVTIIHAVMKGSMSLLLRSVAMYLPLAVIGTIVATQIIQMLIMIVDDMCAVFINLIGLDLANFMQGLADNLVTGTIGVFLGLFLGLILVVFSLYLWLVFLLRDGSVYMAVMFMPVGFAMMVWPMAARYFRKMVEFLVGIIVAKLVMVVIISLSIAALAGSTGAVTAGANALYPDGSIVAKDNYDGPGPDGKADTPDDELKEPEDKEGLTLVNVGPKIRDNWEAFWKGIGFVLPAIVMLGLAALSPPMTIKLIGNLGLGEMAGQMADTLNTQSWLYQYIGMERQSKIWFRQPKEIYNQHKRAVDQKKELRKTSQQEKMLESMGVYRDPKNGYHLSKDQLMKEGFDEKVAQQLSDWTDPNVNSNDANLVALAHKAREQGPDNLKKVDAGKVDKVNSMVIHNKDGTSVIVPDVCDRKTKAPIRHFDSALMKRALEDAIKYQKEHNPDGEIAGVNVISPVQMQMDNYGRYVGINKQQEAWAKKVDRIVADARSKHGTKKINISHYATVKVNDKVQRDLNDNVHRQKEHPTQGQMEEAANYDLAG